MSTLNKADWDLVCSYLHWNGSKMGGLSMDQEIAIRKLGDGFGRGVTNPELLLDWSHIRDSSNEAVTAMANKIREFTG